MENKKNMTVTLEHDEIANFDRVIDLMGFKSRADFIRYIGNSSVDKKSTSVLLIGSDNGFDFRTISNGVMGAMQSRANLECIWSVGKKDKISVRFSQTQEGINS